jgi:hypothetical protein
MDAMREIFFGESHPGTRPLREEVTARALGFKKVLPPRQRWVGRMDESLGKLKPIKVNQGEIFL